jgi:hypothetical protein
LLFSKYILTHDSVRPITLARERDAWRDALCGSPAGSVQISHQLRRSNISISRCAGLFRTAMQVSAHIGVNSGTLGQAGARRDTGQAIDKAIVIPEALRRLGEARATKEEEMKKTILAGAAVLCMTASMALADKATAPGQNKVCLISFGSNAEATAGADATITDTKYLPSKAANKQETYSSGGATRIFDYGAGSSPAERDLCRSLAPSIP